MLRLLLALILFAGAAHAQDRRPSHCIAVAETTPGIEYLHRASFGSPVPEFSVRISYIDHSMFLIQTEEGLSAVTDYNGYLGATLFIPDVVTMNNSHNTHWTAFPDPAIRHVLQGWPDENGPADHYVDLGSMLVRNVTTDTRGSFGSDRFKNGNSIFVFEVAGLCVGHLGHLHHEPSDEHYAALGRVDVVMAAVDGGITLDTPTMVRVLKRLKSSIVLPMHAFNPGSMGRFLDGMSEEFAIEFVEGNSIEISLRDLPSRPTVMVMRPRFLADE